MGFRTSSARRSSAQSAVASSIVVLPDTTGTGPTLSGGGVTANTTINKQIVAIGTNSTQSTTVLSGVTVTSVFVTDSSFNNLDDTALDPAGGYLKIIGNGFKSGCTVYLNGSSVTTTFMGSTELRVTTPSTAAGTYNLMVFNPDGNGAIYLNLGVSNFPAYTTSAGSLGTVYETNDYTQSIIATGDAPLVYSLYSGSLPPNATLSSNGVISGTSPVENASNTYSFVVNVKDSQGQDSTRSFSLTISTDSVSWSSPANNTVYTVDADQLISNVTLSATSSGGKTITYTANTLPTGITLSGNTIYGTPNTEQTIYTELTATANTSNRTAKRYISWTVNVGDAYAKYVSLMLSAKTTLQNASYINDNSPNKFLITPIADTRASNFSPYTSGYYSAYFDGTGDYLQTPASSTSTIMGGSGGITSTSTFTVEGWIYQTTRQSYDNGCLIGDMGTNGSIYWGFGPNASGKLAFNWYDGASKSAVGDTTIPLNTWTHIALSVSSGSIKLFVNGILQTITGTSSTTNQSGTFNYLLIGGFYTFGSTYGYYGFISNLRITKSALYSTTFTPSTTPLTAIVNTSLLACQSNRFIDTSNNVLTITRNGDTTINTANPFSVNSSYATYGSGYFDGTGDYLNIASTGSINIGTNDLTLEGWVYRTSSTSYQTFFSFNHYTSGILMRWETTVIGLYIGGTAYSFSLPDRIPLNVWTHVALVRTNGVFIVYFNGVEATRFNSTYSFSLTSSNLGRSIHNSSELWNGYISDVRLVANTALYTANTAPPTAPLTAIANTQLLTLQTNGNANNAFHKDGSSFNNIINKAGNPSQGTFSPYGDNWSNYFDGSGDYLSLPSNAAFSFGTGDFTVESWVYYTSKTNSGIFQIGSSMFPGTNGIGGGLDSSTNWLLYYGNGSQTGAASGPVNGTWYHVAVVRSSGTTKMYVNGTSVISVSDTTNYTGTYLGIAGIYSTSYLMNGYISNFRVVKGTSLYTTTFTPPTAPLTAVANTQLLTCNTNRFIDESPNNLTVTRTGDTLVSKNSPFSSITVPKYYSTNFSSGAYVTAPITGGLGSGDFTIEGWVYLTTSFGNNGIFHITPSSYLPSNGLGIALAYYGSGWHLFQQNTGDPSGLTPTPELNRWYHFAMVKSGSTFKTYINGIQIYSASDTTDYTSSTYLAIGAYYSSGYPFPGGNISNFRIVRGTALYSGSSTTNANFTVPTEPLTAIANTVFLGLQSDKLVDNSTNNFTITPSAVANIKALAVSPFTPVASTPKSYSSSVFGGSIYLPDTSSYPYTTGTTSQVFGTGDFTVECWIYPTATAHNMSVVGTTTNTWGLLTYDSVVYWQFNGGNAQSGGTVPLKMWSHIAVSRTSGVTKGFLNGVQIFSAADTNNYSGSPSRPIGSAGGTAGFYMSDFRVVRGKGLYTSNFYPGTTPLTAIEYSNNSTSIANTAYASFLLSGTSAGVIDASRNNTIETVGDVRVTTNTSPYATTSQSYYFDGTGDYLKSPSSPSMSFGTGDFTIEMWAWFNDIPGRPEEGLIETRTTSAGTNQWLIYKTYASTTLAFYTGSSDRISGVLPGARQWVHIAICRSSGSTRMYINGTQSGSTYTDTNNYVSSGATYIGCWYGTDKPFNGYISDLRVTKGYARYTTNFTVPSGPLSEK